MTAETHAGRDRLLALSALLNQQAFAQPPVDGWLRSFLVTLYDQIGPTAVQGIQIAQLIGSSVVQMGSAGSVPAFTLNPYPLDQVQAVRAMLQSQQKTADHGLHVYPIPVGNQIIAILSVYADSLDQDADDLLTALVQQLGPALAPNLKRRSHTGVLTRHIDMLRALYDVTKTISSSLESAGVLKLAARSLVETLGIDHITIVTFDEAHTAGMVIAEHPDNGIVGMDLPVLRVVYERMVYERRPIVLSHVEDALKIGVDPSLFESQGIRSFAAMPMIVQNELVGFVGLDVYYGEHDFTDEELEGAMAISSQIGISIHNAQLYSQVKRQAEQLEHIAELSRLINGTFDRRRIFQIIKDGIHKLIATDLIAVALRSPDSSVLQLFILGDGEPMLNEFEADETGLNLACTTAEPLIVEDIVTSNYPDYKLLGQSGMRTVMIVPLVAGGSIVGALAILNREPAAYSMQDASVAEQISNQLVVALENARLYAQASQRAETERLMNRLSGGVQTQGNVQRMLLTTVQDIAEALGAHRARVRLQPPPSQALNAAKLVSLSSKIADKLSEKLEGKDHA